jgi:hypothetical protein
VKPDPLDELLARVDQGDVDVVVESQVVGRQDAGVSAADHDHAGLLFGHLVSSGHPRSSPATMVAVQL